MGGSQSNNQYLKDFDLEKYERLNPDLTQDEIMEVYGIFTSLEPKDGYVSVNRVQALYYNTQEYSEIRKGFASYQQVDFDQFFSVVGQHLNQKKSQFQNVQFESAIQDVSCFLCPMPFQKETVGRDSVRIMTKNT